MKFYANRCEFRDDDSKVPARESLMVAGNDLYCFRNEKLVNFKAEINGKIQVMSCCKSIPKTTTSTTTLEPITTQPSRDNFSNRSNITSGPEATPESKLSENQDIQHVVTPESGPKPQLPQPDSQPPQKDPKITLLDSQKVIVSILNDLTKTDIEDGDDAILQVDTSPVPHIKLRGNDNNLPSLQTEKKSLHPVEFGLDSLLVNDPENQNNVKHCCRYSSAHYLTSSVFTFLVCFVLYVFAHCLFNFS